MTCSGIRKNAGNNDTYRNPVANSAEAKRFLLMHICSFQTQGIGRIRIAKSEITLKIPELSELISPFKQWPVIMNGFQSFSRGLHMKIFTNRVVIENENIIQMQSWMAAIMENFSFRSGTKILRYCGRIESLTKKTLGT